MISKSLSRTSVSSCSSNGGVPLHRARRINRLSHRYKPFQPSTWEEMRTKCPPCGVLSTSNVALEVLICFGQVTARIAVPLSVAAY
jgi:hypothetical protein